MAERGDEFAEVQCGVLAWRLFFEPGRNFILVSVVVFAAAAIIAATLVLLLQPSAHSGHLTRRNGADSESGRLIFIGRLQRAGLNVDL